MDKVVIVGAGAAGVATADALRAQGHTGSITLLGDEPHEPYDRPPLSKQVLAGEWPAGRVVLRSKAELAAAGIDFRPGAKAVGVDSASGSVSLIDGSAVGYDALVVATGVTPRRLPFGHDLGGVHVLRGLDDAVSLRADLAAARHVVVVGAGFLGTEVTAACRKLGAEVALVDNLQTPLQTVLGDELGGMIAALHRSYGVALHPGCAVTAMHSTAGRVTSVELHDGTELAADVVVVAIGSAPRVSWLRDADIRLAGPGPEQGSGGVRCDAVGRAGENVWAVGDVAAWWSPARRRYLRVEHRLTANHHAQTVARDIMGSRLPETESVPYFWSDQYDLKLQSYGLPTGHDRIDIVEGSLAKRSFVAVYTCAGRVSAVVGAGMARAIREWRQAVADQRLHSET